MKGSMLRVLGVTIVLALLLSVSSAARAQLVLSLTSAGAGSVSIPAGYDWTNVTVQCWGGGGGGGDWDGCGGGGGAYSGKTYATPLVAGAYSCYVGAGGGGGNSPNLIGSAGGNTIWNYGGVEDIIAGGGGGGGTYASGGGIGGLGGTVGAGTGYSGGAGGIGGSAGYGGGGGGAGGPSGPGGQGGNGIALSSNGSGGAGSSPGGNGGNGDGYVGFYGAFPGGGGGGAGSIGSYYQGGQGGNGEIVVNYTPVYCGQVTWSASGGSWGTLTSNFGTNWGGAGYGSPGLDPSFPDSATLGSSVPSGTATVTLDGASPSLAALTFSNSAASYTIASGSGGTLHLNGGTVAAALTDSAGSHTISAPVALDTSASVTVTNPGDTLLISGPVSGNGGLTTNGAGRLVVSGAVSINGGVTTSGAGTVLIAGPVSGSGGLTTSGPGMVVLTASNSYTGGTTISAGTLALGNGGTTGSVVGNITNNATLLLNFAGNQPLDNSVSGSGNVVVGGPGTVTLQVPLSATQTVLNQGQLIVASGAAVNGDLVIGSSGHCTNNGDMSNIGNFTNAGIFAGNAQVSGSFSNAPTGTVRIAPGQSLYLQGACSQNNAGLIQLIGTATAQAEFESAGPLTNATGGAALITAQNAILNFDNGLTNQGAVAFSYGISNVSGNITNTPGSNITVTGGASVTFYGDVAQNGTLVVSKAGNIESSAVFLGAFSGSGGFTGGGDVFLDGDLRPSDPVEVTFGGNAYLEGSTHTVMQLAGPVAGSQYDQIKVTGQLVLAGDLDVVLLDGYLPQPGQSFQLFDGELSGAFSEVSLPALSSGLQWNTSNLSTNGTISVTPEPSTLALLAAGAIGLIGYGLRRRRVTRTVKPAAIDQVEPRDDGPAILSMPSRWAEPARRAA